MLFSDPCVWLTHLVNQSQQFSNLMFCSFQFLKGNRMLANFSQRDLCSLNLLLELFPQGSGLFHSKNGLEGI